MDSWKIFNGNGQVHTDWQLPPAPSWRPFGSNRTQKDRGETFQLCSPDEISLVNAALYLRRPLLVTGKPGTGKTSLAYAVAYELGLGEVLSWSITTRTSLKDGLYSYDAIGRLQDAQPKGQDNLEQIGKYIQLGPLGTALLPSDKPRVLLIDEIDKSDIDLPNDLLHVFEEGRFEIPELIRIAEKLPTVNIRTAYTRKELASYQPTVAVTEGRIQCNEFPFVILTSNGERDFPAPFLRRCLRLSLDEPDDTMLARIITAHLGEDAATGARDLINEYVNRRQQGELATDQLLNVVYLMTREDPKMKQMSEADRNRLLDQLLKYLSSSEDA
jgi:MoxR-like ATPase